MRLLIWGVAAVALAGCMHVSIKDHPGEARLDGSASIDCAVKPSGAGTVTATPVASHAISDTPGKTLTSVRLDVTPGANSNPHKHAGMVYVYVLEGAVCSQITGDAALKPYKAGDTFFEPPGSHHLGFTNPTNVPAKVLVTFVANTGDTLTSPLQ